MKNFMCFVFGILVGIIGYVGGNRAYTIYQERSDKLTVDDIVGTYAVYEPLWRGYEKPNPLGFPEGEWVIVITKLSDTKFKIDGSISTTGEINNGEINVFPTKYKRGAEHIDVNYTLRESQDQLHELYMYVECIGEAYSKNKLKLYSENIYLDLRKVADYDYRAR